MQRGLETLRLQERRAVSRSERARKSTEANPAPEAQFRSIRAFFAGSGETGLAKSSGSGQAGAGAREGGLTRRLFTLITHYTHPTLDHDTHPTLDHDTRPTLAHDTLPS